KLQRFFYYYILITNFSSSSTSTVDSIELKSRILSLQLIHSILSNSVSIFKTRLDFINDVKKFLCFSLLKNSASTNPSIFNLSISIFKLLMEQYKQYLKVYYFTFYKFIIG